MSEKGLDFLCNLDAPKGLENSVAVWAFAYGGKPDIYLAPAEQPRFAGHNLCYIDHLHSTPHG